jgi:hypothetical protein
MKRAQKVSVIAAVAVLGSLAWLCLPSGAHASPIGFGGPDIGEVDFTGTGTGALVVAIPPQGIPAGYNCVSFTGECGGLQLSGAPGGGSPVTFTTGPGPGTYQISDVVQNFSFTQQLSKGGVVDTVTGTIHWQFLESRGSGIHSFASLTGFVTITSSSGDAEFVNDFHAGSVASIFGTMNLFSDMSLDELALIEGSRALGTDFRGSIVPIPEPSSLLLLSSALISLGAIARRLGVMT